MYQILMRRGLGRAPALVHRRQPKGQAVLRKACKPMASNRAPDAPSVAEALVQEEEVTRQAPYLEPALRAFSLGVGAGAIVEMLHVMSQVGGMAASAGAAMPVVVFEELAPVVVWDNIAAITACAMFYGIEVAAIMAVLQQYPEGDAKAARAIMRMPTLPKRLMPLRLSAIKRAIYALIALRNPSTALSIASPASLASMDTLTHTPTDDAPSPSPSPLPAASAFRDDSGPAVSGPSARGGAGTSVLDRPTTPVVEPPGLGAPGAPMPRFPGTGTVSKTKPKLKPVSRGKPGATRPPTTPAGPKSGREGLAPGAWAPSTDLPLPKRERELRDRRAYLKNFWYAAAISSEVKAGEPKEVKMLGRTVVLFRDEADGKVRCIDNVCPHRGAPLSKGWIKEDSHSGHTCVVCPYHGWAFDGTGVLREVPSSPDQDHLPKRPLVDAYPVEEKGGFVYLFFGSKSLPADERPPIPWTPELEAPGWQAVYGEMEFNAPHWSVFDNALDMAHIHYLHSDSFGNQGKPVIMDMSMERDTFQISGSFRIHNKPVSHLWDWTKVESVPVEYKAFLPSTSAVKITLGAGVQMVTFVNTVPIDANRSVNRFCLIRNFAGWEGFDVWARNAMFKILGEDKVMVEQLQPEGMRAEVSLEADLPQIAFRRLRQEWVDMGYTAAPEVTASHKGSLDI